MRRTTVNGFTVVFSYRDIDADLHDLDRRAIAKAIQLGFYSGLLSDAYQSPGSWCVVR